jgi:hypothetical protein
MFRILRFFLGCVNKKERSSVNDFHIIFTVLSGVQRAGGMDRRDEKRYNDCAACGENAACGVAFSPAYAV